jgi:hypothetical protein
MYNSASPPFGLGETLKGTDSAGNLINTHLEGAVFEIPDLVLSAQKRRTGHFKLVMVVRNRLQIGGAGVALLGKRHGLLQTDAGATGYTGRINGYAPTLGAPHAVAIDDQLPAAGCAYNDLCYVTLKGYHTNLTPAAGAAFNGDIAAGAHLVAATAAGSTTSVAGRVSNIALANNTDAAGAGVQSRNLLGTALSGKTTGQTAEEVLMYVRNNVLI